jgi:hypothetical protein
VSRREEILGSLFAHLWRAYTSGMSIDLPAVIPPQPVEAHSPEPDVQITLAQRPQEGAEPTWVSLATPLVPGAAHGLSRAVLEMLEGMGATLPTIEDLARATVKAACALAADASLPAEVRLAALQTGADVIKVAAQASHAEAERKTGYGTRVLQMVGLATVVGAVVSLFSRRGPEAAPVRVPAGR